MTDQSISPLRRRMLEDMTVRGFMPSTKKGYIRTVKDFTAFLAALRTRQVRRTCEPRAPPAEPLGSDAS